MTKLPTFFAVRYVREFLAETLGTFALVIFGDGAVAQVVLGNAAREDTFFGGFLNISFGYGLALMIGICISGGVSGGHLNPAVTLAMAAVKNLKPLQVTKYLVTVDMLWYLIRSLSTWLVSTWGLSLQLLCCGESMLMLSRW